MRRVTRSARTGYRRPSRHRGRARTRVSRPRRDRPEPREVPGRGRPSGRAWSAGGRWAAGHRDRWRRFPGSATSSRSCSRPAREHDAREVEPVHLARHHDVAEQQVDRADLLELPESGGGGPGDIDPIPKLSQLQCDQAVQRRVILDRQNTFAAAALDIGPRGAGLCIIGARILRQVEPERRADTDLAIDVEVATGLPSSGQRTQVPAFPQIGTASECRFRWLRVPDLNLGVSVRSGTGLNPIWQISAWKPTNVQACRSRRSNFRVAPCYPCGHHATALPMSSVCDPDRDLAEMAAALH